MSTINPDPTDESEKSEPATAESTDQAASATDEDAPAALATARRDPSPRSQETPALNRSPATPRRGGRISLLLALVAIIASGYVGYRQWRLQQQPPSPPVAAIDGEITMLIERQGRTVDANRQRGLSLETRLDELQAVNETLREQLLSLGQRQSLSEDVIADLARDNAPSGPRVEIAEAEYLLLVGQTRLQLFGDVAGARLSLQLADQVLAASGDPLAGSVRGAISAELDALNAVPVVDRIALQARLDALSANADQWPLKDTLGSDESASERLQPWYSRVFQRLVDIRKVQIDDPLQPLGPAAARLGLRTHLALARLLLLQGRESEAARSLEDAARSLELFDPSHPEVAGAQRGMAEIIKLPLGAPLPTLGTALDELRRVRNLRGMANPQAAHRPAPGPSAP